MINPKIFHYFKKALKWEIIIICASFAYIMPWYPAHAAATSTWNGRYMMLPDYDRATQLCDAEGLSFYPGSNLSCRTNGAYGSSSPRYINGYRFHYQSQPVGDRDIDDENGDPLYEGGEPVAPLAPDISSCTRTQFGYNTGSGSGNFPDVVNHRFRDADGCVYKADLSGSSEGGSSLDRCLAYPDSANPDDVWCYYNVVPDTTTAPPADNGDPQPPDSTPSDNISDTTSTTDIVVSPTETLPDGTTIDVTTTTTTTVDGVGTTIDTTTSEVIITNTDGTTTVTETTETITIRPDGSRTERIDEVITITRPDGTRTRISKSDGTVTIEDIPGGTRTDTNWSEKDYSPTGQPTGGSSGSSSESTGNPNPPGSGGNGDGNGNGDGEGQGEFCEYAQVVCDFIDWMTGDEEQPEVPDLPIEEIDPSDMEVEWNSGLGAGSCPANPQAELMGMTIDYEMDVYCQVASDIIYWLLIFSATIAAGFIIAGLRG